MNPKFLSYLGLAQRARKLATGEDIVLKSIRSGSAKLVIIAQDASENTKKKFYDKCSYFKVPIIETCSRYELGGSIGKDERVILAIEDAGFAKLVEECFKKSAEVEEY